MDATSSKRLIDKISLFVLGLWVAVLAIRLLLAPLDSNLLIVATACLGVFLICHLLVLRLQNVTLAGSILLFVSGGSTLLLAWLSGGPGSPVLNIFPLVPLVSALLFGRLLSWTICSIMCLTAIGFYLATIAGTDPGIYSAADEMRDRLSTIWVVFATTACTTIANYFHNENLRLNDALENQARIDYLTGLPNKRGIEERLGREISMARRTGGWISTIMLDIDFFKRYNDAHGHARGDQCLRLIAECLRGRLRRADDFVGRYGGEEFIALLPDTAPEACMQIAEDMRRAVEYLNEEYPALIDEKVTITLGCYSTNTRDGVNMDDMVSRADRALYEGKRLGRNRVISAMDKQVAILQPSPEAVTELNQRRTRRKTDPEIRS